MIRVGEFDFNRSGLAQNPGEPDEHEMVEAVELGGHEAFLGEERGDDLPELFRGEVGGGGGGGWRGGAGEAGEKGSSGWGVAAWEEEEVEESSASSRLSSSMASRVSISSGADMGVDGVLYGIVKCLGVRNVVGFRLTIHTS